MEHNLVFYSEKMKEIHELAKQYAPFSTSVMIQGETGVGKEVIANTIHKYSPKSNMPFIKVNCGAISESLADSELLGYENDTLTGNGSKGKVGIFESAYNGSLLLDEVGELSPILQAKLLRALQEQEVKKPGISWSKSVDVRIITCTNLDIVNQVKSNKFRKDLFYRLNVANIEIPPLRERKEDIMPLLECFLGELINRYNIKKSFSENALFNIYNHKFEGNVRELKNIVESSYITAKNEVITLDDLPRYLIDTKDASKSSSFLSDRLDKYEKEIISNALLCTSSIRSAASLLGLSNATLLRRIEKYDLRDIIK